MFKIFSQSLKFEPDLVGGELNGSFVALGAMGVRVAHVTSLAHVVLQVL